MGQGDPRPPPPPFCGLLNISALHVQCGIQAFDKFKHPKCTRLHLGFLKSYWAITSISKIFPQEHAHEISAKSAPFALSRHIATVYYISRPPLSQNPPSAVGVATLLQFTSAETHLRKTANYPLEWKCRIIAISYLICFPGAVGSFLDNAQVSLPGIVACNHMKSVAYFTASISNVCTMTAFPCGSWRDFQKGKCLSCEGACPQMGYNADQYRTNKTILAFLTTDENEPFCGMSV